MKKVKDKEILVGADFAGFPLKEAVCEHLRAKGWKITDVGVALMLPADKPQLLVLVLMQDVKSADAAPSANAVAAPVAKQIAEQGIKLFNIAQVK